MNQTLRRIFVMLCAGVGVWILVFWLYEPKGPNVTYGGRPYAGGGNTLAQIDTVAQGPGDEADGFTDPAPEPSVPLPEVDPTAAPMGADAGATEMPLVPRVVPPEFWEYTVQRGDTSWESIAEKTLGDRKLASAVLRANPLVSPDKLIPGRTRLKIPRDPKNIQGKVVSEPAAPEAGKPAVADAGTPAPTPTPVPQTAPATTTPAPTTPAATGAAAVRTHTVAKGETLSSIAEKHLGSAAKWRELYAANRGVIDDPDRLKLGTVLTIPAKR